MGSSNSARATNLEGMSLFYEPSKSMPEIDHSLYRDVALFIIRRPTSGLFENE